MDINNLITTGVELAELSPGEMGMVITGGAFALILSLMVIGSVVDKAYSYEPPPVVPTAIIQIVDTPEGIVLSDSFESDAATKGLHAWIEKETDPIRHTFEKGKFSIASLNAILNKGLAPGRSIKVTGLKLINGDRTEELDINLPGELFPLGDNKVLVYYNYSAGSKVLRCVKMAHLRITKPSVLKIILKRGERYAERIAEAINDGVHNGRAHRIGVYQTLSSLDRKRDIYLHSIDALPAGEYSVGAIYSYTDASGYVATYSQSCLLVIER